MSKKKQSKKNQKETEEQLTSDFETLSETRSREEASLMRVRAKKRIKPRFMQLTKNEIKPIHATFLDTELLLDDIDHFNNEDTTSLRQATIRVRKPYQAVRSICLSVLAMILASMIYVTCAQVSRQANTNDAIAHDESSPEAIRANAGEIAEISEVKISSDDKKRTHITAKVSNKSEDMWNVHMTANVKVRGTDERGEVWEGTLKGVPLDSDTKNVAYNDQELVIGHLDAASSKRISVYPRLDGNRLESITIDKIVHIDLVLQDAILAKTDSTFVPAEHITLKNTISEDGSTAHVTAIIDGNHAYMHDATLVLYFTDTHFDTSGTREEDNVTFPFGISQEEIRIEQLEENKPTTASADFDIGKEQRVNPYVNCLLLKEAKEN